MPSNINSVIKNKIKKKYISDPPTLIFFQHVTLNTHIIYCSHFRLSVNSTPTQMPSSLKSVERFIQSVPGTLTSTSHWAYSTVSSTLQVRSSLKSVERFLQSVPGTLSSTSHWAYSTVSQIITKIHSIQLFHGYPGGCQIILLSLGSGEDLGNCCKRPNASGNSFPDLLRYRGTMVWLFPK